MQDAGAEATIAQIAAGHRRTVARAISWIENGEASAGAIVAAADRRSGNARVIGVTGVPGAGKSTLVPTLARRFAESGGKPAILAVDPSSPLTGGAILGDRIRDTASADLGIFFRSVASRGSLGGLSHTLDDVVVLLDAAGFDPILIETVGTGQSEVAVSRLAHTTLLISAPGLGDEIQAMKAGILEVTDLIAVNKADADRRGAELTAETLRNALTLSPRLKGLAEGANAATADRPARWLPPVRAVSALKGDGIDELVGLITAHRTFLAETGALAGWRTARRHARFREALRHNLIAELERGPSPLLAATEAALAAGTTDPITAAATLAARVVGTTRHT